MGEYKDFMEQFCSKCPEAAEARQWLNEELASGRNNNNRLGVMFGTKLRDMISMKNINKYNIEIDGVEKANLPDLVDEIRKKMKLRILDALGFDIDYVENESDYSYREGHTAIKNESNVWYSLKDNVYRLDSAYCIDSYMKNNGLTKEQLSPEFKMIKRLQDCRKVVNDLKSVNKIREIKPIASEDMVHDMKLMEKAKFATKILTKMQKINGDDRIQFIKNSTQAINSMMDNFEKFVDDKYKDKKIYFYKDKVETDLYKEWKAQQIERRSASKNQEAFMMPKELMQMMKLKEQIKKGINSIAHDIEHRGLEEKAAIVEALNIPANGYLSKKTEIYERNLEVNAYDGAKMMHSAVGDSFVVDFKLSGLYYRLCTVYRFLNKTI